MPTKPPTHQPAGSVRARAAIAAQYNASPIRRARMDLYDYAWRLYSQRRLGLFPWCVRCDEFGRTRLAVVTDHIRPHRGDPVLFRDPHNHQSLCKRCHDHKTRVEDGGGGRSAVRVAESATSAPGPASIAQPARRAIYGAKQHQGKRNGKPSERRGPSR